MKYLLDTHILLWATTNSDKLSQRARDIIANPDNDIYFSTVSIWEIAIKMGLGKLQLPISTAAFRRVLLDNQYLELNINSKHAILTETLPPIHKDPFDRMLIAQAQSEGFTLISADNYVIAYGNMVLAV